MAQFAPFGEERLNELDESGKTSNDQFMRADFCPVLASTNIVEIFSHCDVVGQVICSGLGVFSIVAWAVMFGKRHELVGLRRLNLSFERRLGDERSVPAATSKGRFMIHARFGVCSQKRPLMPPTRPVCATPP